MPKSRHRTSLTKTRRPRKKDPRTTFNGVAVRISPKTFEKLRDNDDFVSVIKAARLMNAIVFAMQLNVERKSEVTPVGMRSHYRTIFLFGGFLYEGFQLIDSFRIKYRSETFFAGFESLRDPKWDRARKIVQLIRHNAAFHFDSEGKSTKKALRKLNLPTYEFFSGESQQLGDLYFNIADTIDLNYLIDELKGTQSEQETQQEIYQVVVDLMQAFVDGGTQFILGLSKNLKLLPKTRKASSGDLA